MKTLQLVKQILFVSLLASLILLAGCNPADRSTPTQKPYTENIGCLIANDFYAVYFSAYLKPDGDLSKLGEKERTASLKSYCKYIPRVGVVYFTADLIDDDVRNIPVSLRVVEQKLNGEDATQVKNFEDIRVVSEQGAKLYPRGVVQTQVELDKKGYYALYLSIGEVVAEEDVLRIPLIVGADPNAQTTMDIVLAVISIILGIIMFIAIIIIILSPILPIKRWRNSFFSKFGFKEI